LYSLPKRAPSYGKPNWPDNFTGITRIRRLENFEAIRPFKFWA
jgi:hypothetical protein